MSGVRNAPLASMAWEHEGGPEEEEDEEEQAADQLPPQAGDWGKYEPVRHSVSLDGGRPPLLLQPWCSRPRCVPFPMLDRELHMSHVPEGPPYGPPAPRPNPRPRWGCLHTGG